jgi:hypothetical protein
MNSKELIQLGKQFLNLYDLDEKRDCLETSLLFINWIEPLSIVSNHFKLLVGIDKNTTEINFYPFIKYHAVVLDTDSNIVLDLTYNQFNKTIPIKIYSKKEFRNKYNVDKFKKYFDYENKH